MRLGVLKSRFFWKVYLSYSLLTLVVASLVTWVVVYRLQASAQERVTAMMHQQSSLLKARALSVLQSSDPSSVPIGDYVGLGKEVDIRVSVLSADGGILVDTEFASDRLGNQLGREEIQGALETGFGQSERFSDAMNVPMIFVARAIYPEPDHRGEVSLTPIGVIRVAQPLSRLQKGMTSIMTTVAFIAVGVALIALLIGSWLAHKVALPIGEMNQVAEEMRMGNYERRVELRSNDEVGRLADTLNRLGSEMTSQIADLKRLERVRRDFVANVSHEIKTPLTSIKGYVETLKDGALEDEKISHRFLDKIDRNAARLTTLVQDLLSLAKIESQESHFNIEPTQWNAIVQQVVSGYEDAIQEKGLKISVNEQSEPLVVKGDKEAMIQVLDNLLTNAIKYTPAGGHVYVSLTRNQDHGFLIVKDTGIGIPAKHLDRIFERFYRVDKARSREMGGTGLGLSIVKHLVQCMAGEIGVESQVGLGSRFTVRLALS